MDPTTATLSIVLAYGIPTLLAIPLGYWMRRTLDPAEERAGIGLDRLPALLAKLVRGGEPEPMNWRRYAFAMLNVNLVLFLATFALLYAQSQLPLNPDQRPSLGSLGYTDAAGNTHNGVDTAVVFNTVCSFVTNTNLQHYSGEQHLSYLSQLAGIVWLQFVTPAIGLCVMLATLRGIRGDDHLGDFHLDLMRVLVLVLLPLSLLFSILLVAGGVPMTFQGAALLHTLEGADQTIARGPVAALVAIKQLGTNGGGFFGPNSTHPFENPSTWTNLLELIAIPLLPMASLVMAGLMLRNMRHAVVIFCVMLGLSLTGAIGAVVAESYPSAAMNGLPISGTANMEGKEVRLGVAASATWAAITTSTSNGSVNSMHDSLNPLTGLAAMALMMLNVAFSGVGAGFENMLMYIVVAVFLAGLMVGRTPEYLGKKVEAKEVKLAMIGLLLHPLLICAGTAIFAASSWRAFSPNPGPHGFSEILYEFSSAAANNGSGFEGLADNNPPWNIATGIVLLFGRYPALILPLAIAGFLSSKKRVPTTSGTLRCDTLTFAMLLAGTIVLVGALSFLPAVVLGPISDQVSSVGT